MPRRSAIVLAVLIALVLAALGLRVRMARWRGAAEAFSGWFEAYPAGDRLVLKPAAFKDLPGWEEDALEEEESVSLRRLAGRWPQDLGRPAALEVPAISPSARTVASQAILEAS